MDVVVAEQQFVVVDRPDGEDAEPLPRPRHRRIGGAVEVADRTDPEEPADAIAQS